MSSRIDFYIEVIKGSVDSRSCSYMETWRIFKQEVMNNNVFGVIDDNKFGSSTACRHIFFGDKPRVKPPNISSPINFPSPIHSNIVAIRNSDKVRIISFVLRIRIMLNSIASNEFTLDLNDNIPHILNH